MPIGIAARAVVLDQEAGEACVAVPTPWIARQSEADGRPTTELKDYTQHRVDIGNLVSFFQGE
jgi:hypothetical protein